MKRTKLEAWADNFITRGYPRYTRQIDNMRDSKEVLDNYQKAIDLLDTIKPTIIDVTWHIEHCDTKTFDKYLEQIEFVMSKKYCNSVRFSIRTYADVQKCILLFAMILAITPSDRIEEAVANIRILKDKHGLFRKYAIDMIASVLDKCCMTEMFSKVNTPKGVDALIPENDQTTTAESKDTLADLFAAATERALNHDGMSTKIDHDLVKNTTVFDYLSSDELTVIEALKEGRYTFVELINLTKLGMSDVRKCLKHLRAKGVLTYTPKDFKWSISQTH